MEISLKALAADLATELSTKASVPTGVPRTGWPGATVDPSPRRRA